MKFTPVSEEGGAPRARHNLSLLLTGSKIHTRRGLRFNQPLPPRTLLSRQGTGRLTSFCRKRAPCMRIQEPATVPKKGIN
jgi:hypothetical protein